MRWQIHTNKAEVPENSYDYFEKTLITGNGFREYDVRWLLGSEVNPNGFVVLGRAYARMLKERYGEDRVIVGHDFRRYSQDLSRSLVVGLLSCGMHVIDVGLAITPMVYFAQHRFNTCGAAMCTASHNENGWTGLKLASGLSSTLGPEGILEFRRLVEAGKYNDAPGTYESYDQLFDDYLADLLSRGQLNRRIRVVLAAGNGTAGRFAPTALRRLGCEVIEQDCTADWNFPNHNPNPEDVSFLHGMSHAVVENHAELGIGIDGDGDRIGVVDDRGQEIFSDKLGLLVAHWLCPQAPGRSIVVDVKSTSLFFDDPVLRDTGTKVVLWKTGHSYIKSKVAEVNALAGFEKSGHWFLNRPFGRGYDDALLAATAVLRLLAESGRPLSEMLRALPRTWQSPTLGAYCPDDAKYQVVERVTREYTEDRGRGTPVAGSRIKDVITVNGVRFVLEDGSWGLVRASSNKPSLVVVAESRTSEDQLYELVDHLKARLAATGQVGQYDQEMPQRAATGPGKGSSSPGR